MENYCRNYLESLLQKQWTSKELEIIQRIITECEVMEECNKNIYKYLFTGWYLEQLNKPKK